MIKILPFIIITVLLAGCKSHPVSRNDKPVARAYESYLYASDLSGIIPPGTSAADSATLAKDYIEKWIRNQLVLNKAEMNLTDAEKDVELQIESYRSSLLIYAYQQSYLRQNLDTVVTDKELDDYYNQNKSNFILSESLFKGLFIKVPAAAPEIYKLRQWYRSDDPESIKNLEAYCFQQAAVYDDFEEHWVKINEVLRMLPENGGSFEPALLSRKYLETRDKDYLYFLSAKEIAPEGTVSPFDLVNDDIHYIILNKRKILLINQLEMNIYADAQNHEYFTIYTK
jgi:hypothetical protein